jgi:4-diphosphocytidyl-2-C-methyl-D-erythritol kinase
MILYPYAKVNIGLEVLKKRADHYHDLETIFYPLNLCDILEINKSDTFYFSISGIKLGKTSEENIVEKAFKLLQSEYNLPAVQIHLHKQIPVGAGLGGGSSDAAFTLIGLNTLFRLNLDNQLLSKYASTLGSDCAFFLSNQPLFAEGTGNIFSKVEMDLRHYSIVLIKPDISISTSIAYNGVKPVIPQFSLRESIKLPVKFWKERIENRFETGIFESFPQIKLIKEKLYCEGAVFASMSGSGSSVFGLFEVVPKKLKNHFPDCFYQEEKCKY